VAAGAFVPLVTGAGLCKFPNLEQSDLLATRGFPFCGNGSLTSPLHSQRGASHAATGRFDLYLRLLLQPLLPTCARARVLRAARLACTCTFIHLQAAHPAHWSVESLLLLE
jgi:hypothetical protein